MALFRFKGRRTPAALDFSVLNSHSLFIIVRRVRLAFATAFGLGRFPFSGSLASIAACFFAVVARDSGIPDRLEFALLAAAGSAICLACAGAAEEALGKKDPPDVVADEFAGMWLALAVAAPGGNLAALLATFAAFRIFDGAKPLGIRKLQAIPGAAGILVDDLVAGALAGAVGAGVSIPW
jgi:phosphatidylglycerophosphatase A